MSLEKVFNENEFPTEAVVPAVADDLLKDLRSPIDQARTRVSQKVNTELVMLNWHMGNRMRKEILRDERAEYGKEVLLTLSHQLTLEYGRGFERSSLFRMVQFAELFPDRQIVATLSHKLGWSHFIVLRRPAATQKSHFWTGANRKSPCCCRRATTR